MMDSRSETGKVMHEWKWGVNVTTNVHSQSLNQSLIFQNITTSLLSANTQSQLANTHQAGLHRKRQLITHSVLSGRGLWDASGTANPATDTCRGHHGATYTGADGDRWRVVWVCFPFLWKKIACNHVIKDHHRHRKKENNWRFLSQLKIRKCPRTEVPSRYHPDDSHFSLWIALLNEQFCKEK